MHLLESIQGKMNALPQHTVKYPKKQSKFTKLGGTWNKNVNMTTTNFPKHYKIIFIHFNTGNLLSSAPVYSKLF